MSDQNSNILFISGTVPGDISTGAGQRTTLLYRALAETGKLHSLVLTQKSHKHGLWEKGSLLYCPSAMNNPILTDWLDSWMKYFTCVFGYGKPEKIKQFCNTHWPDVKFDIVVCRYMQNLSLVRPWQMGKIFVDLDDLPMQVFHTIYAPEIRFAALKEKVLQAMFNRLLKQVDGLWLANQEQMNDVPHDNKGYLPNIPWKPNRETTHEDTQQEYILSVGNMQYQPNHLGVDHFLEKIWPKVHDLCPKLVYKICGAGTPEHFVTKWKQSPNVELLGFVKDIEETYRNALFSIAPVYAGAGTCIKVLESLRLGRACVCSSFAARGLTKTNLLSHGCLVAQDDLDFARLIASIINNPKQRLELQKSAPMAVEKLYNYGKVKQAVFSVMDAIKKSRGQ